MQGDEPSRHGRAADAFISSYLRELLADDAPRTDATTRLQPPIAASRAGDGAPLGASTQPAEAGIQYALE